MRKFLLGLIAALAFAGAAYAAPLPLITGAGVPGCEEGSQTVACLNTLIQQFNGQPGYTGTSQVVSPGLSTTCTSATSTNVCNSQHGVATFTGVAALTTGSAATFVITNSFAAANSQCFGQFQAVVAAGSGPYVSSITPTAGSLSLVVVNGGTTTTGAAGTFVIAFNCL